MPGKGKAMRNALHSGVITPRSFRRSGAGSIAQAQQAASTGQWPGERLHRPRLGVVASPGTSQ